MPVIIRKIDVAGSQTWAFAGSSTMQNPQFRIPVFQTLHGYTRFIPAGKIKFKRPL